MGKILGLDVGEKRIGLATSDELGILVSGQGAVLRKDALDYLPEYVKKEGIDLVVVGMPYLPSGGLGSQAEDVKKFMDQLSAATSVKLDTESEVLTSVEAENRLKDMKIKIKDKSEIDEMAAMIILESYLRRGKNVISAE